VLCGLQRALGMTTLAAATFLLPVHAQSPGEPNQQTLTLETPQGRVSGVLRLPASTGRPPLMFLVAPSEAPELAAALAREGVASLRIDSPDSEDTTARWIAFLRNDARFPTVSVLGEGQTLDIAVVAARAARADGVVVRGSSTAAEAEIPRLVAAHTTVSSGSVAGDAAAIAAFVRKVPVLGRRGTSAARPTTARRSPRQVVLASVGPVRIGIEWGQPQKRGREIWGSLVRWNEVWMPGADEATTVTTNGPLRIGALSVPAGDHTVYLLPGQDRTLLIISNDVGQFHTVHDRGRELGRVELTEAPRTESVEGLTFSIDPQGPAGVLRISWDTRDYSVPVSAPALLTRPLNYR
jgi:hypothetical protein